MQAVLDAFYEIAPNAAVAEQQVMFGTSGHRGCSLNGGFNRAHIMAIAQAVADYRQTKRITGPLFLGRDSHALSLPAWEVVLQVLAANAVEVHIEAEVELTATPLVSHAILQHNTHHPQWLSDGIIITPSHNPPTDGGIKYNPPHGGPADADTTAWIEEQANRYLASDVGDIAVMPLSEALDHATRHDFVVDYVAALDQVVDMSAIAKARLKLGVDPMGGTALPVWQVIAKRYLLDLDVVNTQIDSSFAFMPLDHDGKVRMDCSSSAAMANLLAIREQFDLAFGNDPDADRHGIVDAFGLMNPNHFLAVCIDYLLGHRPEWSNQLSVGKTLVSSSLVDRVVADHARTLYEVPVGFKWFVDGLHQGWLAFGGEESAGASFLTRRGKTWSTDKDGIILCLLAAEITAVTGKTPSEYYRELVQRHGEPHYRRVDTPCTPEQKAAFKRLKPESLTTDTLAGDLIEQVLMSAPGNQAPIGGVKVMTENGWFAARPSGTEALYKVYAESFRGKQHLNELIESAQSLMDQVLVME